MCACGCVTGLNEVRGHDRAGLSTPPLWVMCILLQCVCGWHVLCANEVAHMTHLHGTHAQTQACYAWFTCHLYTQCVPRALPTLVTATQCTPGSHTPNAPQTWHKILRPRLLPLHTCAHPCSGSFAPRGHTCTAHTCLPTPPPDTSMLHTDAGCG